MAEFKIIPLLKTNILSCQVTNVKTTMPKRNKASIEELQVTPVIIIKLSSNVTSVATLGFKLNLLYRKNMIVLIIVAAAKNAPVV